MFAHEQRLERWLGEKAFSDLLKASVKVRCPVPVANVPGKIFIADGLIFGAIEGGGFASFADFLSESKGKTQILPFAKSTVNTGGGRNYSLWAQGVIPPAGGAGTAGTGRAVDKDTEGALPLRNPGTGDTLHLIGGEFCNAGANRPTLLLLYDRLWDMTHTITGDQAVDSNNLPTRYQTATSAVGNFISGEVTTTITNNGDNLTITYIDQDGNTAEAGPTMTSILRNGFGPPLMPFTSGPEYWFYPLNSDDSGVRSITNIDIGTHPSAGVVTWFIGHPLLWIPQSEPFPYVIDGVISEFQFQKIESNAALALLGIGAGSAGGVNVAGYVRLCSG